MRPRNCTRPTLSYDGHESGTYNTLQTPAGFRERDKWCEDKKARREQVERLGMGRERKWIDKELGTDLHSSNELGKLSQIRCVMII